MYTAIEDYGRAMKQTIAEKLRDIRLEEPIGPIWMHNLRIQAADLIEEQAKEIEELKDEKWSNGLSAVICPDCDEIIDLAKYKEDSIRKTQALNKINDVDIGDKLRQEMIKGLTE